MSSNTATTNISNPKPEVDVQAGSPLGQQGEEPKTLKLPGLDSLSRFNRFIRIDFPWELVWFSFNLKRPLRPSELWDAPNADTIGALIRRFDARFEVPAHPSSNHAPDAEDDNKNNNHTSPDNETQAHYEKKVYRSLMTSLFGVAKFHMTVAGFCMLLRVGGELATPFLVNRVILSIKTRSFEGLYYAIAIFVSLLITMFAQQQHMMWNEQGLNRIRSVANYVIFRKAGKIRSSVGVEPSEVAVLIAQDTQRFVDVAPYLHLMWASPLQIIVGGYLLYFFLGLVGLFALGLMLLLYPLILVLGRIQMRARAQYSPASAKRVQAISELLTGISVVKMYAWENFLLERILALRKSEMKYVRYEFMLWSINVALLICFPTVCLALTFLLYINLTSRLQAEDAFATLSLLAMLKFPVLNFGNSLMLTLQMLLGCQRIGAFLAKPDAPDQGQEVLTAIPIQKPARPAMLRPATDGSEGVELTEEEMTDQPAVIPVVIAGVAETRVPPVVSDTTTPVLEMKDVSARWSLKASPHSPLSPTLTSTSNSSRRGVFSLSDVNFSLRRGDVYAVRGAVGSGKSMLCSTILGETVLLGGRSVVASEGCGVAFAAQEPFLLSGTVRDNIIFHETFDERRYRKVIDACCLWADLDQYEDGEMTIVGERGITLSGGQKARIALARAVYSHDPALVILDDPFSALDAGTGKRVAASLLDPDRGLLRDRAVLLVTHARQIIVKYANMVIHMHDGTATVHESTPEQLKALSDEDGDEEDPSRDDDGEEDFYGGANGATDESKTLDGENNTKSVVDVNASIASSTAAQERVLKGKSRHALVQSENVESLVSMRTYLVFYSACGGSYVFFFVILFLAIERFSFMSCDYLLAQWVSASDAVGKPDTFLGNHHAFPSAADETGAMFYWRIYIVMAFMTLCLGYFRLMYVTMSGTIGAVTLFERALKAVLRCPMEYFDRTPTGRLINRFAHDTDRVGFPLISVVNSTTATAGWTVTGIIVMAVIVPWSLLIVVPSLIALLGTIYIFRSLNAQLQRLDSAARSDLQSHVHEALVGATVVRAFNKNHIFLQVCRDLVDANTRSLYAITLSQRWIALRCEFFGICAGATVAILLWAVRESISPGLAGMAITWGLNVARSASFAITDGVQADARLVSVDRLDELHHTLTPEAPRDVGLRKTPDADAVDPKVWPSEGSITFAQVHMRYREELPLTLQGTTFTIKAGQRVGVIGRTGSGKSSLVQCLFRLREIESGTIAIDGVDIASLGLDAVRGSRMAIIPQDPVLFSGTIRSNVDPFEQFSNEAIEDALKAVALWDRVEPQGGLEAPVHARGANFSTGQKQLICIARAVLRRPSILVMDEATANVDHETDLLIQKAVRTIFRNTTIFEIAHRLHTVADADVIVVMSKGVVAEYGAPVDLLDNTESALSEFVRATGPAVAEELTHLIRNKLHA